ncbi:MAG: uroporphyrinogen-III synthase [Chloroherpetonaceae bacterium]|nr:uroporphyrinogen-III synthase [Chloroherpetonaceae bacterium]MDW8438133.1 uroporphyrinogen-III synthase [Chloroherpetonaceae bacterium]
MPIVLVTRPKDDAEEFVSALASRGFECAHVPTIEIAPIADWQTPNLAACDGIIFTSVNAVRCFIPALLAREPNSLSRLRHLTHYAVGEKTLRALRECGIESALCADEANADHLANLLKTRGISGKRFLFACGNRARSVIPTVIAQNGGVCDELVVYETRDVSAQNLEKLKTLLACKDVEWASFFSPSAAASFFNALRNFAFPSRLKFAAIGKTTQAAIEAMGFRVDAVASVPSAEALAEAIASATRKTA